MKIKRRDIHARVTSRTSHDLTVRFEPWEEHLRDQDFGGRTYDSFGPVGSQFDRCSFRDTTITSASLGSGRSQTIYWDCSFEGSGIDFGAAGHARLERCMITNVRWSSFAADSVEFIDCTFSGRFEHGFISARVPRRKQDMAGRSTNEIRGNDFRDAEFVDFELRGGVDLVSQHVAVPQGAILLTRVATELSTLEANVDSLTADLRVDARVVLEVLRYTVAHGQIQVIIDPRQFPSELRPAVQALVEAARGLTNTSPITQPD